MDDIEWNIIDDVKDNNIEPLINNIFENNIFSLILMGDQEHASLVL